MSERCVISEFIPKYHSGVCSIFHIFHLHVSEVDLGFPDEGCMAFCQNLKKCYTKGAAWYFFNLLFGQIFCQKLHENEENWTEVGGGGTRPKFYCVDRPLRLETASLGANKHQLVLLLHMQAWKLSSRFHPKQECIPVGWLPPAHWPYPVVFHVSQGGVCPTPLDVNADVTGPPGALSFDVKPEIAQEKSL